MKNNWQINKTEFQPTLLGLAIFSGLCAVSFQFNGESAALLLSKLPLMAVGLMAAALVAFLFYIQLDKLQIIQLQQELRQSNEEEKRKSNLLALTKRQKEVIDLMLEGKSNKEIASLLYIEKSTLKSHINQIYKKLKVENRNQLRRQYQQ